MGNGFSLSSRCKYIPQMGGLKGGRGEIRSERGQADARLVPTKRDMTIRISSVMPRVSPMDSSGRARSRRCTRGEGLERYPSNAELVDRLAKLPLAYQPGTTWDCNHSTDVLDDSSR